MNINSHQTLAKRKLLLFDTWFLTNVSFLFIYFLVCKKKPVDFDDELKTGDVRYDNLTKITIKVQLF